MTPQQRARAQTDALRADYMNAVMRSPQALGDAMLAWLSDLAEGEKRAKVLGTAMGLSAGCYRSNNGAMVPDWMAIVRAVAATAAVENVPVVSEHDVDDDYGRPELEDVEPQS